MDNIDPSKLPPEVLQAMLALSGKEEENSALAQQMRMGQMLSGGATEYQNRGPSAVGGFAGAVAQGLQGYTGGKNYKDTTAQMQEMGTTRKANRGKYFDWAIGKKPTAATGQAASPFNPLDDHLFE